MGAPAVSSPARRARTQAKPRPAPKPAPKSRAAAKPRSAATRTAPARRTTARPARRQTSGGSVVMLPLAAAGRTAVAVGGLADCGLVTGMARSRVWIGVLGVLLGGIVAINVYGLSLSAGNSATAAKIDALERDNSVARGRIAARTSTDRIETQAAAEGLGIPPPDAVHYLHAAKGDAAKAANRLSDGLIAAAAPVLDPSAATAIDPTADVTATVAATDPTIDPVTGAAIDPVTGAPVTTDPAVATTALVTPTDPTTTAP
jgi:hypothetical protein